MDNCVGSLVKPPYEVLVRDVYPATRARIGPEDED